MKKKLRKPGLRKTVLKPQKGLVLGIDEAELLGKIPKSWLLQATNFRGNAQIEMDGHVLNGIGMNQLYLHDLYSSHENLRKRLKALGGSDKCECERCLWLNHFFSSSSKSSLVMGSSDKDSWQPTHIITGHPPLGGFFPHQYFPSP